MWVALVAAAVGTWYMRSRRPGRDLYAVGQQRDRPRCLVGIPVMRREILAFAISGTCAGLAGVLFLGRFGGIDANAGLGYELPVIAACVVGGVSIAGGNGTVVGALIGALVAPRHRGLALGSQRPEFWQQAVNGTLLLLAITADRVAQQPTREGRRAAGRLMSRVSFGWDKGVLVLLGADPARRLAGATRGYATTSNLGFVVQDIGEIMIVALIMTLIIITGEIDLSVGSMVALTGCVLGVAWRAGLPDVGRGLAALVTGAVAGALNGFS